MSKKKLRIEYVEDLVNIYVGDDLIFTWYDGSNIDSPEDLCWGRDLQRIFDAGYNCALLVHNIGEEE